MTTCDEFLNGMKVAVENKIQKENLKELKNRKNKIFISFVKNK